MAEKSSNSGKPGSGGVAVIAGRQAQAPQRSPFAKGNAACAAISSVAVRALIGTEETVSGVYNAVAPGAVRNKDFTAALARESGMPARGIRDLFPPDFGGRAVDDPYRTRTSSRGRNMVTARPSRLSTTATCA